MLNFILYFSLLLTGSHPLYLSNTLMQYDEGKNFLSVKVQIFETDIQEILMIAHGIDIVKEASNPNIQKYVDEYIWHNLKIRIDGVLKSDYVFIKKGKNFDALIYEYQLKGVTKIPNVVKVEATYLMELFEDQTNIVTVSIGKKKKTFPLKAFNTEAEFKIN